LLESFPSLPSPHCSSSLVDFFNLERLQSAIILPLSLTVKQPADISDYIGTLGQELAQVIELG
jgi:hypothetical protein